jgi:hypothetical protein
LTQQEIDMVEDEEGARWQERIEQTIRRAGLMPCDASGCDSGDPLDWSDTQIGHALNEQNDRIDELRMMLARALGTIVGLRAHVPVGHSARDAADECADACTKVLEQGGADL